VANNIINKIKFTPVDIEARKKLLFQSGDTVKVWSKIPEEKGKFRLQVFEGTVLARKHGTEAGATFTVRKVASGVGVERIFPLYSPMIDKIELVKKARARRSKLYYIRDKAVKDVRRKMRGVSQVVSDESSVTEETPLEVETEAKAAK
jgi:large subunit ribosomal protein L19